MEYDFLAIGTPVVDVFARVPDSFLEKNGLRKGSTNFIPREKLDALEAKLGKEAFHRYPGDNARNICETLARLKTKFAFSGKDRANEDANVHVGADVRAGNAGRAGSERGASGWSNGGAVRVAFAGRVGNDKDATLIGESLSKFGAATLLEKSAKMTGQILCLITPDAQRTFAADLAQSEGYSPPGLPKARFVFATTITLLSKGGIGAFSRGWIALERERGAKVAISLESPKMIAERRGEVFALLRKADYVFLNEEELAALGIGEDGLGSMGAVVFLKKGAKGSVVFAPGQKPAGIVAEKQGRIIDTTGAGDAYAAGALYSLIRGEGPIRAAKAGSKTGAAAISTFGASLPVGFSLE